MADLLGSGSVSSKCDAHVGHPCALALGMNDEGIDVQFGDLGEINDELRKALQTFGNRLDVSRRLTTEAFKHFSSTDGIDHVASAKLANGHQTEADVLEYFDVRATQAEHDEVTKCGIFADTEDDLDALARHRLNLHAEEPRTG